MSIKGIDDVLIAPPIGWDGFFADESLVLPEDFELGDDPMLQDRELFQEESEST